LAFLEQLLLEDLDDVLGSEDLLVLFGCDKFGELMVVVEYGDAVREADG
jgi:hypothetical protein